MKRKKLSVVMSSYNKGKYLIWTLLTLVEQAIPPDEIVIVDDGSTDGTKHVVNKFQQVFPDANIKYYYNNNQDFTMCAQGMNCGIKLATSEIIMLTMPELLHPTPDVKMILDHFENPENDESYFVGRPVYYIFGWDLMRTINREHFRDPIAITKRPEIEEWHPKHISQEGMISYYPRGGLHHAMGIQKKHLLAVGGYDERFSQPGRWGWEDIDLFQRIAMYGLRGVESFEAITIHLFHGKPVSSEEFEDNKGMLDETAHSGQWEANVGKEWGVLKK